jgi:hypothetical protein
MRRHIFWSLTALFVIGAGFPTQARTINLFCEIPAAHADGDGGNRIDRSMQALQTRNLE